MSGLKKTSSLEQAKKEKGELLGLGQRKARYLAGSAVGIWIGQS